MRGGTGRPFGRIPAGLGLKLFIAIVLLTLAAPAGAQEVLPCGSPVRKHLDSGQTDTYRFSVPAGAVVLLQRSDLIEPRELIRLRA